MESVWRSDTNLFDDPHGDGRGRRGSRSSPKRRLKPIKARRAAGNRLSRSSSEEILTSKHGAYKEGGHDDAYSYSYSRSSHIGSAGQHMPTAYGSGTDFAPNPRNVNGASQPLSHDIFDSHPGHARPRGKKSFTHGPGLMGGSISPNKKKNPRSRLQQGMYSSSRNGGARKLHTSQSTSHLLGRCSPGGRGHTKVPARDTGMEVWDMESLKQEVANLKARLKGVRTENVTLAAHKQRLEVAAHRKDKQLETVVTAAIDESGGISRPSRQQHGTGALLEVIRSEKAAHLALQRKQREEARELKAARAELSEVRESLKFTQIKEIQLKSQVFYDEALRCQRLVTEQRHEHSQRMQEMHHEHSRKVARMQAKVVGLHHELDEERDLVKKLKRDVLEANDAVKMLTVRLETVEEAQETNRKRMQTYQRKLRHANYAQGPSSPVRGRKSSATQSSAGAFRQQNAAHSTRCESSPLVPSHANNASGRPLTRSKSHVRLRPRNLSSRSRDDECQSQFSVHGAPDNKTTKNNINRDKTANTTNQSKFRRSYEENETLFTAASEGDVFSEGDIEMFDEHCTLVEQESAALTIQRVQRGRVARRRVLQLRQERGASQLHRTADTRRPSSDPLRESSLADRESAALAIQRVQRGRIARRQVHALRQHRPAEVCEQPKESASDDQLRVQRGRMARRRMQSLRVTQHRSQTTRSLLASTNLGPSLNARPRACLSSRSPTEDTLRDSEHEPHHRSCVPKLSLDRVDSRVKDRPKGDENDRRSVGGDDVDGEYSSGSEEAYESEFTVEDDI